MPADGGIAVGVDAPARHARRDVEAERAVLGAVLLDNLTLALVDPLLAEDGGDFWDVRHRIIWPAIREIARRGEPIDALTLQAELRARERINSVGGMRYLHELTDYIPTIAHAEAHARLVADAARVRRLVEAGDRLVLLGSDPDERVRAEEVADFATSAVFEAARDRAAQPMVRIGPAAEIALAEMIGERKGPTPVSTGLARLDALLEGGLRPGDLAIIAGRPGMGKTGLAMAIAHAAAASRKHTGSVLFFSLEMQSGELIQRLLCARARVELSRVRGRRLAGDDIVRLTEAVASVDALPLLIDDAPGQSLTAMRAKARRLRADARVGGLRLVVVDYLQLAREPGAAREGREQEVAAISRGLKELAKELSVPVIALSQLNRECEKRNDKRPMVSDLRETGQLEQDADLVLFTYRDELYNKDTDDKGIAELIIGKQRSGPTGTARVRFAREFTLFENLAEDPTEVGGVEEVSNDGTPDF